VQAFFAKTFKVKSVDQDTRWGKFKQHVLGKAVADEALTEDQVNALNAYVSQEYEKQHVQASNGTERKAS
jgi:hypothetical protein